MRYARFYQWVGWFMAMVMVLALAGCAARGELEVLNEDLSDKIDVQKLKSRTVGGLTQAQVKIKNKTKTDLRFRVKFVWFDGAGFEIDAESTSWRPVLLHGKEEKSVQAVAPNGEAKTYKVLIR